jgi:hypothetical protein
MNIPHKLKKEELDRVCNLKVGDLRKFLEENTDLTDDAPVLVQRVEDIYFERNNWPVYMKEGFLYRSFEQMNDRMMEEIERRSRGEDPHYEMEHPEKYIHSLGDEEREQYVPTWKCVKYPDENALFIDLHY